MFLKHKHLHFYYILVSVAALATVVPLLAKSQIQELKIVKKLDNYKQQVLIDPDYKMVELKMLIPTIVYDLRYATKNNFTGKQLYKKGDATFLRLPVAKALAAAQKTLQQKGMGLKIYDAYRPYAVTQKMWELVKDERYVANPAKGSGHNRGLAVDLSLIDLGSGKELDMGTGFDNFTDTAHHSFQQLSMQVLQNRKLLKETLEAVGFKALETEWWHYHWPNDKRYDVLDIDFKKLKQQQ